MSSEFEPDEYVVRIFARCLRFIGTFFVLFLLADLTTLEETWHLIVLLPLSYLIECLDWWERRQTLDSLGHEGTHSRCKEPSVSVSREGS